MNSVDAVSMLGFGFVLGLKHALDADHLVAVSTIVSERKGWLSSSIVGALWGVGHTISLLAVGLVVIAMHVRIPDKVAQAMEFAVALMLIVLGMNVLVKLLRGAQLHAHPHTHGDHLHTHPHIHEHASASEEHHEHSFMRRLGVNLQGKRPVFIGMVHGLAGSAALMLVVLATISSRLLALLYIGVFGVGSVGGMMLMSALIGLPFVVTAHRFERLNVAVRSAAGLLSVGLGVFLAWQIGIVEKLF